MDHISDDEVSAAQDVQSFRGDVADDADSQARAREWLTVDHFFREAQLTAQFTDFIFEEFAERFDEGEFHILRKPPYIVMGFDGGSGSRAGFHDVRIEGALDEEFHVFQLVCFFLEGVDEFSADGLSLLFRFGDAFQEGHEMLGCIDVHQLHVEFVGESIYYLFCFAETEEAVVYEDAGELVADGSMNEHRSDGGVYAAGERADDIVISYFFANIFYSDVDVVAHGPAAFTFADLEEEVFQHGGAFRGVYHFRMELHSVEATRFISHRSGRCQVGVTGEAKACRHIGDSIAMAHPYSGLFGDPFKEGRAAISIEIGVAVFVFFRFGYFAA